MYIGAEPNIGNYTMLDAITTSATATYNLLKGGASYTPENPLGVICSLNGVIQKAGSSFNIVNNTIVFSQALTSNDSIDFILVMGERIDLNVPADASVTNAKTNFVSTSSNAGLSIKGDGTTDGTLQLNCSQNSHGIKIKSPPHSASASYTLTMPNNDGDADQFLQTDGSGVLSWASASGGITEADQWRITANITADTNVVSANLERSDSTAWGKIGTGMSQSSGYFSFPSTGIWKVSFTLTGYPNTNDDIIGQILATTNNSSYSNVAQVIISRDGNGINSATTSTFIDCTDTAQVKVNFKIVDVSSGSTIHGDTSQNKTFFEFIRLGDT